MHDALDEIVATRAEAHAAASSAYQHAQALIADGHRVRVRAEVAEDDRSLQQNRFYWGVVLREISEQARIAGQRYTVDAWHELFKRQFLGFEIEKVAVAGRRRPTVIRRLRSTTRLKVRAMSKYLEQVLAFGAADLGVVFSSRRWEDYRC